MEDLQRGKGNNIKAAAEDGKTFLAICGGYQLLGHYYQMSDGTKCEYIGAIDVFTVAGEKRMIGNTACISEEAGTIVGFENHAGKTFLSGAVKSLGTVLKGREITGRTDAKVPGTKMYLLLIITARSCRKIRSFATLS